MQPLDRPADADIRMELDAVLSSAAFARSERLRAFLSYVITKEMAGLASQLKGYTIAVDVFRRPDAFNADSDPLVRVHAGKLRKLLSAYYDGEGADALWQISIPKGGYTPVYLRRMPDRTGGSVAEEAVVGGDHTAAPPETAGNGTTAAPAVPDMRVRKRRRHWLPAPLASPMALISIVPLLLFAPLSSSALGVSPQVQARFSLSTSETNIGLPRVTIRSEGTNGDLSSQLAAQVRAATDYYAVIIPAAETRMPAFRERDANALAFTIAATPVADGAQTRVTVTSDATGDVVSELWIASDQLSSDFDMLFESLGIASRIMATNGDIFLYAEDKGIASPLMHCMLMTDTYRREKSRNALMEARLCQKELLGTTRRSTNFVISASELKKSVHR